MKENIKKIKEKVDKTWSGRSKSQKSILISSIGIIIAIIIVLSFFAFNPNYAPLYNNLSMQEVSQIKGELEARGVPYEIAEGGTAISVPKDKVNSLLVDLAGQGIPKSGGIDYSFFSENATWGITDNEFNMMKLDAMNTELANLIKGIEGINDASVLINLPKDSIFVSDAAQEASASIILHTKIGHDFKENQIESLYHLVSKAVPNLPPENIVIRNQYLEYFDIASSNTYEDEYTYQQTVKSDIERDIQRRLQQMLGAMVGMEKVIVSVTADIDFTKENRIEELVDPVDLENMEGLPVSIETIHETYTGNSDIGGITGTGDEDIANYPGTENGDGGDYELVKETINNEFNRIRKDIVESPYKVRDLGIQVAVDNVKESDGEEVQYLSAQDQNSVEAGITSILNSMISTSVDKEYGEVNPAEKISIVFQEFSRQTPYVEMPLKSIPLWMYITGGILLIIIIVLIILLMKNKQQTEEDFYEDVSLLDPEIEVPEINEGPETESGMRRKQLEKMAKEKPEDFAKLLRSWIVDD